MKRDLCDFSEKEKKMAYHLYNEGFSIHEISDITHLLYYEVLYILRCMKNNLAVDQLVSCASINDTSILIISDTHLGSKYENMDYIKKAYNTARKMGISSVIHGGDLIQSTISNVKECYNDEKKQLEHVVSDYPYDSFIKNYILLGNHDYNTLKKNDYYFDILKERDDMQFLGFKRAYISWQDHLISISHTTKKYHLYIPSVNNILNLRGHSHRLSHNKTKSIDIPTLSDDLLAHKNAKAGFLIGNLNHRSLEIDSYYFDGSLKEEGTILKKII